MSQKRLIGCLRAACVTKKFVKESKKRGSVKAVEFKVFRYSFSETIPTFFYRLKRGFIRVRSL